MSRFWLNWLNVWCLAVAIFGVVLAGGGFEATSGPVRMVFEQLKGPGGTELTAPVRFLLGVLGPISVGWSLTFYAAMRAVQQLDKAAARPIWILLVASVACWFFVDSAVSVHTGFWRNTIPNAVLMGTFLVPVIRSGVLKK